MLASNALFKARIITLRIVWAWFHDDERAPDRRAAIVFGLIVSCAAVLIARALSLTMRFPERPLRNPPLHS